MLALLSAAASEAMTLTDSLPGACGSFTYILRVKARRTNAIPVEISFSNGSRLTFQVPSLADAADGRTFPVRFVLADSAGRTSEGLAETTIDSREGGFGLRIDANAAGLRAAIGGPHSQGSLSCGTFDTRTGGVISATVPDGTEVLRRTLRAEALAPRETAPFSDLETLKSHIDSSTDAREGFYTYLDKDIPTSGPAAISQPEGYSMAVVADPETPGGYLLIYLSGNSRGWEALEIKGRLRPTVFMNHFDLEWTDAGRHPHRGGSYAQFSENNSILKFAFPELKASFRMARTR